MTDANTVMVDSWSLSLHDKSPKTREQYQGNLQRFAKWLDGDLLGADRRQCEKYFLSLEHLSQNTKRARWVSLRSFYSWALEEEEIGVNPMARIKVAKSDAPPPDVLKSDEVAALLKACQGRDFYARRDLALVRYYLSTGVRLSEGALLLTQDVDLKSRIATFMGKGGKRRIVRFDPATAAAIDRYIRSRSKHRNAARPELWLGLKGAMTESGVTAALERRAHLAGIEDFHAHRMRHTFADAWKRAGGSEESLMQLGGWADPSVMQRYGSRQRVDRALNAYDEIQPFAF